jgi:hypothetical protein
MIVNLKHLFKFIYAPTDKKQVKRIKTEAFFWSDFPAEFVSPYCDEQTSFKVCVDAYMRKLTMAEKLDKVPIF